MLAFTLSLQNGERHRLVANRSQVSHQDGWVSYRWPTVTMPRLMHQSLVTQNQAALRDVRIPFNTIWVASGGRENNNDDVVSHWNRVAAGTSRADFWRCGRDLDCGPCLRRKPGSGNGFDHCRDHFLAPLIH